MPKEGQQLFGRLLTAMVTPYGEDGALSTDRTSRLARHLVDTGTETIVVSGTTGESPTHREREHDRMHLLTTVLREVGHECKVVAGTSTYNTEESVELSKMAQQEGANGLLLVTPYYNNPSQNGMYRHFARIAKAVDIPCILYNVTSRTTRNLLPETVLRLDRDFENIVGLKEAIGTEDEKDQKQVLEVLANRSPGFGDWSGNDADTAFFMLHGGDGVVSVASHICGREIKRMFDHYAHGELDEAEQINRRLMPYFKALFPPEAPEPSPSAIKASLNDNGIPVGGLRDPVLETPEDYREYLQVVLTNCGLAQQGGAK